jgi:hypothetical protein
MATSRSNDAPEAWTAGVRLFSGRPDPRWTLTRAWALRLEVLWRALQPGDLTSPTAPPLGYRGCLVCHGSDRRWEAYQGVVTLVSEGGREVRKDPRRAFERLVFETAPTDVLPARILELAGLGPESSTYSE